MSMADDQRRAIGALVERLAAARGMERARLASELIAMTGSAHVAKAYFRAELQDTSVQTEIGEVRIIGGTFKEMKRGMASDGIKAALVPMVPDILRRGRYDGPQLPHKQRDDFVAFHFFSLDGIEVGGLVVSAGVTVGERAPGTFEFSLTAYGLGHSGEARWQKRIGEPLVRGSEPRVGSPQEQDRPVLDSIVTDHGDDGNIVILSAVPAAADPAVEPSANRESLERRRVLQETARRMQPAGEPLLDGLTSIERARTAAALAAKVKDFAAAAGAPALERMRLARDMRELIVKLGGSAAAPVPDEIRRLLAIARGDHDDASLPELFGLIQEAMGLLQDAGQADEAAASAANAAITRWAELEEKANV